MRIGLMTTGIAFLIIFLIMINTSNFSEEKVDTMFEGIDANFSDTNYSTDQNLSNFIKYTVKGVLNEFHGTYYLAAWISPHLPRWLLENADLLATLAILVILSPLIAVIVKLILLIFLALTMWTMEQIKKRRKRNEKRTLAK